MQEILSHPVPAVILLLGVLIVIHELGHYLAGRWCGIAVEIFSIGFGPRIFSWKSGFTEYRLGMIPLGGFVKFYGASRSEDVPLEVQGQEYFRASTGKRAITVFAGPLANFLLAFVVYFVLASRGIELPPSSIGEVLPESRADVAGIESGDVIKRIDEHVVRSWVDIEKNISKNPEKDMTVVVEREGKEISLPLKPAATEAQDIIGKKVTVGRAGVALGMLPSVITIVSNDTVIAKLGFSHGDKILDVNGKEIRGFFEFIKALKLAKESGAANVAVKIQTFDGAVKSLNIDGKLLPEGNVRIRQYAEKLGVRDSQMSIAKSLEESGKVMLYPRDVVLAWNDKALKNLFEMREMIMAQKDPEAKIKVLRNGKELTLNIVLKAVEVQKAEGVSTLYTMPAEFLGQSIEPPFVIEKHSFPFGAIAFAAEETGKQTVGLVMTLGQMLSGQLPLKSLGGPILIAKVAGESVKAGFQAFFSSMALISVNLGVVNLFPIPVLDGGQLVLIAMERLRRRPLSEVAIENFQKIGFVLIFSLVIIAMYNDVSRFWKSMVTSVMSAFQ